MTRITLTIPDDVYEIVKAHAKEHRINMSRAVTELTVRGLIRSGYIAAEKAEIVVRNLAAASPAKRTK